MNLKHFHLTIDSNLADNSGQKYGLGSSAAVLVSVVKALNEFYGLELSNLYIYKLAVIANMKLQSLSSCGDIAVSVYSGWLAYSTFDHDWVKQQMEETSVNDVLEKIGQAYISNLYKLPKIWKSLLDGLSPASSPHLVSEVKRLKSDPSFMVIFRSISCLCRKFNPSF